MDAERAGQKVVLIVDDNADVRESAALLLRLLGFRVATAGDGRLALGYLHSHPAPCLILLDLRMPVMNGWQFRAAQCKDPRLAPIPVVICSGEADVRREGEFKDVVAVESKPLDPDRLVELLHGCR